MVEYISPRAVLSTLVDKSGMKRTDVSRLLGMSDRYLSSKINSGEIPSITIVAKVASACGFTVQLVRDDDVIVVEPPSEQHH